MLLNVFWNTEGQNLRKENSYLFSGKKMTKVLKTNVDLQPDLLLSLSQVNAGFLLLQLYNYETAPCSPTAFTVFTWISVFTTLAKLFL